MNENDDFALLQLERELRSLEPLAPDPLLCARLDRSLSGAEVAAPAGSARQHNVVAFPALRRWTPWAAAAMAAVTGPYIWRNVHFGSQPADDQVNVAGTNKTPEAPSLVKQPRFVPVQSDKQFQRVSDGGMQFDNERGLMRRVRFEYNNHQQYRDPNNGAILELSYPSMEDVWIEEPIH